MEESVGVPSMSALTCSPRKSTVTYWEAILPRWTRDCSSGGTCAPEGLTTWPRPVWSGTTRIGSKVPAWTESPSEASPRSLMALRAWSIRDCSLVPSSVAAICACTVRRSLLACSMAASSLVDSSWAAIWLCNMNAIVRITPIDSASVEVTTRSCSDRRHSRAIRPPMAAGSSSDSRSRKVGDESVTSRVSGSSPVDATASSGRAVVTRPDRPCSRRRAR